MIDKRQAGNMDEFAAYFREAKEAGLGVTLHIAEVYSSHDAFNKGLCLL